MMLILLHLVMIRRKHNSKIMKSRRPRALTCLHSALSKTIFPSVMACETPKEIWEKLREEYEGSQRVKNVKLLTLKREFEMHKMKERETVKEYAGKLMEIVNKIKLFGESFPDSKIVEKMLISLPVRFKPKISAIAEFCDLTRITIIELISKLHAQKQRTSLRDDETVEGVFQARQKWRHQGKGNKNGDAEKGKAANTSKDHGKRKELPPCNICERTNHQPKDCWFKNKPKIECRFCKKLGHIEKNCRAKKNQASIKEEQAQHASSTDEQEEEYERIETDTAQNQIQTQSSSDSDPALDVNDDANSVTSLDSPVLKTKSLSKIYEKCNYAIFEPSSFNEAVKCKE
ncbi:hypothetical protein F0562_014406 [Nyssa sinensis]|uniref:CCHC-type domain-containing protein n=1 Tax=Nyssa sinensis TaxID=561372 RepID=A0A5J4ZNL3_9ASTE|nr:hypothetical protein F0562_014406 [Nyssa sinensis]